VRAATRWATMGAVAADPSRVRPAYLAAAGRAVALLRSPDVGQRWSEPSLLRELTVGALAAHLARSVLLVETYLDEGAPDVQRTLTAQEYYGRLGQLTDFDSPLNAGVRERSIAGAAAAGATGVAEQAQACLGRLETRLPAEPLDRRMPAVGGAVIGLDEFLRTRLVELAVHSEDLALSVGLPVTDAGVAEEGVAEAVAEAVDVMVGAARVRHGDAAVLRALTRRERDDVDALRVL